MILYWKKGKCYKGHYWIKWQNGITCGRYDKSIAIKFTEIAILWLCKRLFFVLEKAKVFGVMGHNVYNLPLRSSGKISTATHTEHTNDKTNVNNKIKCEQ